MKNSHKSVRLVIFITIILLGFYAMSHDLDRLNKIKIAGQEAKPEIKTSLYTGKIYHIFFHSLILYPKLAFDGTGSEQGFRDYMVTKDEFNKILPRLYQNNFILIDGSEIYKVDENGLVTKKELFLPEGKKPLILSIDDVNYRIDRGNHGFANRLVLDKNGDIATEVITPEGQTVVTRDGDVMPIIDDFIKDHPDFSFNGAKGILALTGFDGVLGYRTNRKDSPSYIIDVIKAKEVVNRLKATGWKFASHSYTHESQFKDNTITLDELKRDTELWDRDVRPILGDTNIFVGPFGQIFKQYDPRREYLISKGFKILYGVGMDLYISYNSSHFEMDRADIDGIRLVKTPYLLYEYFNPLEVIDPARSKAIVNSYSFPLNH